MGRKLNMRATSLVILGLILSSFGMAQTTNSLAGAAAKRITLVNRTDADILAARDTILLACNSPVEKDDAYTWLVKGYVFKEIYKFIDDSSRYSPNREIAIEAIERCIQLDRTNTYRKDYVRILDFLGKSYFNDAAHETLTTEPASFARAKEFFEAHRRTMRIMDPSYDMSSSEKDFLKNTAQAYTRIYQKDVHANVGYIMAAIESYKGALAIDSLDYDANYNTAIAYYNQGVYKIRRISFHTEIDSLIQIQDECVQLFIEALPYMEMAYRLDPARKETLKGLWHIYRALSEDEKSEFYRSELERLIRDGKIKPDEAPKRK